MIRRVKGLGYGDTQADIRAELVYFSDHGPGSYVPKHFADAVCPCGGREFFLQLDDTAGVAIRGCAACGRDHAIGDSADFLADADPEELDDRECFCGSPLFEITVGVSLYADSKDVRWIYIGCRCPACGLVGSYGDWKNEYDDYRKLLARV